jgi:RNA polymerase sigma-70 factor (ECF subfamily)
VAGRGAAGSEGDLATQRGGSRGLAEAHASGESLPPVESVEARPACRWLLLRSRSNPVRPPETNTMRKRIEDPPDDERGLLCRIAQGDDAAFAMLYDRYGASAYGIALKICNNRALAEDVVQEAFLSIWQRAARFDPDRGSVASYLFAAVHNKAVDAIRHEESLHRRQEGAGDLLAESDPEAVVEAAWVGVRRSEVRAALGRLSSPQAEALQLAYFEGMTCTEVAHKQGVPLGTAKSRLRDGMIRLRTLLPHLSEGAP